MNLCGDSHEQQDVEYYEYCDENGNCTDVIVAPEAAAL